MPVYFCGVMLVGLQIAVWRERNTVTDCGVALRAGLLAELKPRRVFTHSGDRP